jgi:hypothetical protein
MDKTSVKTKAPDFSRALIYYTTLGYALSSGFLPRGR